MKPKERISESKREEIATKVIGFYGAETHIYPTINNTLRYSLNVDKMKPISGFVKYLYESIQHYFRKQYEIPLSKLYRGALFSD